MKNLVSTSVLFRKSRTVFKTLNDIIENDKSLGPQFRVGHSYVTPTATITNPRDWFQQVVNTEIGPLLEEYWFDDLQEAEKNKKLLLEGF